MSEKHDQHPIAECPFHTPEAIIAPLAMPGKPAVRFRTTGCGLLMTDLAREAAGAMHRRNVSYWERFECTATAGMASEAAVPEVHELAIKTSTIDVLGAVASLEKPCPETAHRME